MRTWLSIVCVRDGVRVRCVTITGQLQSQQCSSIARTLKLRLCLTLAAVVVLRMYWCDEARSFVLNTPAILCMLVEWLAPPWLSTLNGIVVTVLTCFATIVSRTRTPQRAKWGGVCARKERKITSERRWAHATQPDTARRQHQRAPCLQQQVKTS